MKDTKKDIKKIQIIMKKKNTNTFTNDYSQPNISKKLNVEDEQRNSIINLDSKSSIETENKEINK